MQRPDQVPADARQAHRLRRPGLGQRLEPEQHALLRQHQPRRPVAQVLRELRALPLTLAKQLRPRLAIARRAQRQPEQIPRVEVHPGQHRLTLAEHLIERPGLDPAQRDLHVEPRRSSLGLRQHLLNRPVRDLHPGVEQRHQVLNRADGVGCEHTQPHHRPAKLCVIDPHIHRRTLEQRRFKMAAKHRLRRRPNGVDVGREISYASLSAVFEPWACCPDTAAAAH